MSVTRTILQTVPLPQFPGWESRAMLITVPPGASVPVHRHPVSGIVYVIQGTIASQYQGDDGEATYTAGQSWIEQGEVLHLKFQNPSTTEEARVIVSFVVRVGELYTVLVQ